MRPFYRQTARYLNKINLTWNLPYWTPLISKYRTGVHWTHWFIWFWTYTENNWTTKFNTKRYYCMRICGFQLQTL